MVAKKFNPNLLEKYSYTDIVIDLKLWLTDLYKKLNALKKTPKTNSFTVTTGSTVTLTDSPLTTELLFVFRQGALITDYTISGKIITFTTGFSSSEKVVVKYFA